MNQFDDVAIQSLIQQAKEGDSRAWEVLYTKHRQRVYKICYSVTKNEADANDALQDTFLKATKNIKTFEGNSKFSTWLYRIALNESLMLMRPLKRLQERFPAGQLFLECDDSITRHLHQKDKYLEGVPLRLSLQPAIESLRPNLRAAFTLQYIEGKTSKEVAKILKTTVPAVKSLAHCAKLQLRKELKSWASR